MCLVAAAAAGGKGNKEAEETRIDMLDIRVGKIVSVQQHPNAGEQKHDYAQALGAAAAIAAAVA